MTIGVIELRMVVAIVGSRKMSEYGREVIGQLMVERGGEGSDIAAPIVGDILKEWFGETDTKVPRYKSETDKTVVLE